MYDYILLIIATGICWGLFLFGISSYLASYLTKHNVEKDLDHLHRMINLWWSTREIYESCLGYRYLNKVEGFAAVVTLFKHRHRKRALERLEVFEKEWKENGLKLYNRV